RRAQGIARHSHGPTPRQGTPGEMARALPVERAPVATMDEDREAGRLSLRQEEIELLAFARAVSDIEPGLSRGRGGVAECRRIYRPLRDDRIRTGHMIAIGIGIVPVRDDHASPTPASLASLRTNTGFSSRAPDKAPPVHRNLCLPNLRTVLAFGPFSPSSSKKATAVPGFSFENAPSSTLLRWK